MKILSLCVCVLCGLTVFALHRRLIHCQSSDSMIFLIKHFDLTDLQRRCFPICLRFWAFKNILIYNSTTNWVSGSSLCQHVAVGLAFTTFLGFQNFCTRNFSFGDFVNCTFTQLSESVWGFSLKFVSIFSEVFF